MDAAPYFVAAASQVVGFGVQRLVDVLDKKDYNAIINDGSKNKYNPPPRLGPEALSQRWARDSDTLLAFTFAITLITTALDDLKDNVGARYVIVSVGLLLPVAAVSIMLSIEPDTYAKATLFKQGIPITPFVYVATLLGCVVGAVVLVFG